MGWISKRQGRKIIRIYIPDAKPLSLLKLPSLRTDSIKLNNNHRSYRSSPKKHWYENEYKRTIYTSPNKTYSIDLTNAGITNFGFTVRKHKSELFSIPPYALKLVFRISLSATGVPDYLTTSLLEYIDKLVDTYYNS